jgi:hypothetical protein
MKIEDFQKAVGIIIKSNSPKVSFRVPINDNYLSVHDILIHESNADLINKLVNAGYSLSMCSKGLSVNKY